MANFRESIDALKEAGLADSEILEILSGSIDGQMPAKNLLENKESDHEPPDKISVTNTETPSIRIRKTCVLSAEKYTKSLRQDSPRQSLERENACPNFSLNRTVSPLSISPNRFSFSADLNEASELAEKALNRKFPELPKNSLPITSNNPKKPAESSKINKKPLF